MLAGLQSGHGDISMLVGGRGDEDRLNIFIVQDLSVILFRLGSRGGLGGTLQGGLVIVTDDRHLRLLQPSQVSPMISRPQLPKPMTAQLTLGRSASSLADSAGFGSV